MASRHLLKPRDNPALLSLVIPAYNEELIIPALRARLDAFLATLPCPVEVIIVNDGSADATLDLLMDWAAADRRIRVLGLARNFGHQAAVTAGLDAAAGDAIAIIDCDLQDPPEVILEMLARYRDGYEVVYGQRASRKGEGAFKRFTAWLFYRLMKTLIYRDLPEDTGDFRLVSRRCLDALGSMRETHRFLRGMVAWVGFAQTAVRYERSPRAAGETKYPFRAMLKFAWTAAVSFSPLPLRIGLLIGIAVASLGLLFGAYVAMGRLFGWYTPAAGWASQAVLTSLLGGAVLISNGILGEYVGRIFEEAKGRPLYIVSQSANLVPAERDRGLPKA
ncbi:MAG TPA: glycosyltransferase family 2 protein [Tepidisphaeraceae bacterium]|jgi:dolichol-phosphate mannosyltransferase|nr:glycosyltransferase family 2 protein [Tepidisphaeraceae bacterium]